MDETWRGGDLQNGQITISPNEPYPEVCVRDGQLWIGGPDGNIWRGTDPDGAGPDQPAWSKRSL